MNRKEEAKSAVCPVFAADSASGGSSEGVCDDNADRTYQNTPSDGGRSGGKEKQLLANSYAGEYQIDFSYGSKETIRMGITYRFV